uniref:DNA-3-methyladenine glycosylase family protein n=1 Tax=Pararhizobium sp. IMCC3301 TaxID=3067904 RepID=UPI00274205D4|nr:DNA-3-methyladenine glycosylase 2 family protein [Pararhizobium sp. IMCC3301]
MQPIRCQEDVNRALTVLLAQDPALQPLADRVAIVPLRLREPGFEGLARIVNSQQLSVASATAIWQRLSALADPFRPDMLQALSDEELLKAGLSRPKLRTLRALSQACLDGLDVEALAQLPAAQARAALTAIHGIGPWTADIFLMFCAGHPDIFPVGDVALQNIARDVLNLTKRPSEKHLARLVRRWLPHRSVAARLLWAYYGTQKATSGKTSVTSRLPI